MDLTRNLGFYNLPIVMVIRPGSDNILESPAASDNTDTQEMDMDGYLGPGDVSIIVRIIKNDTLTIFPSRPNSIDRVFPAAGDSLTVAEPVKIKVE